MRFVPHFVDAAGLFLLPLFSSISSDTSLISRHYIWEERGISYLSFHLFTLTPDELRPLRSVALYRALSPIFAFFIST